MVAKPHINTTVSMAKRDSSLQETGHCGTLSSNCPAATTPRETMENEQSLYRQLYEMRSEHRDLDDAIKRLEEGPFVDQLQLRRLKKRKLQLKEYINRLESKLIPDMDA